MDELKVINGKVVMNSRDVAKMIDKNRAHLMRDIAWYINDLSADPKLDSLNFFIESKYQDAKDGIRPTLQQIFVGKERIGGPNGNTKSKGASHHRVLREER